MGGEVGPDMNFRLSRAVWEKLHKEAGLVVQLGLRVRPVHLEILHSA